MRISIFWGQEHLTDRSISKRYLKNDIATWVEKSSTSRAIHALDTGFYWARAWFVWGILHRIIIATMYIARLACIRAISHAHHTDIQLRNESCSYEGIKKGAIATYRQIISCAVTDKHCDSQHTTQQRPLASLTVHSPPTHSRDSNLSAGCSRCVQTG